MSCSRQSYWKIFICAAFLAGSLEQTASKADEPGDSTPADVSASSAAEIVETMRTFCYDCHTGSEAEGGIKLDFLSEAGTPSVAIESNVELIEKIILVLKEQQMPPSDADPLPLEDRLNTIDRVERMLGAFDCGSVSRPGRVTMRRLNRAEYDNTIRDLTGLKLELAVDFPSDDVGNGFDNIGDVLTLPPILMEKYLNAAHSIATEVFQSKESIRRVFPIQFENVQSLEEAVEIAKSNANSISRRVFRRPATQQELDRMLQLMSDAWNQGAEPDTIYQTLLTALLTSPHFLYRVEQDDPRDFVDGSRALNDFELASRLSYFLWSSMPDERLLNLASDGQLHTAKQLAEEAVRMLHDPKAKALGDNFLGQWLQLRQLETLRPDPVQFPFVDDALRSAMRRETELLFETIVSENRSILELLDANYTFLNERLAKHYGIDGVVGNQFRRMQQPGLRRGVLMHGSVLTLTSNPTRTSPVKRGKWVLDNLLGEPPPPPPPNVPALEESGETLGTLRQQMEQHRSNPNCAVCHTKMDALGFGLENFDAVGRWREKDGREIIEPAGELPGGSQFSGPVDLIQLLVNSKKEDFARCVTKKLLTYALGRGLEVYDRCTVNTIVTSLVEDDYRIETLVRGIVISPQFTQQDLGR